MTTTKRSARVASTRNRSSRSPSARPRRPPINLLAHLDSCAESATPAESWVDGSWFLLWRYPRLQPSPRDLRHQMILRSNRRAVKATIKKSLNRLTELCPKVLESLSLKLKWQLAAIIIDSDVDLERHFNYSEDRRSLTALIKGDPKRRRYLASLDRVRSTLNHAIADGVALQSLSRELYIQKHIAFLIRILGEFESQLDNPPPSRTHWERRLHTLPSTFPGRDDPIAYYMVLLFWFFRDACGLSANESEVRTGLIRNTFWQRWTRQVRVVEVSIPEESRGCNAVFRAVRRFSLPPGA
jgi:hypothetical protein